MGVKAIEMLKKAMPDKKAAAEPAKAVAYEAPKEKASTGPKRYNTLQPSPAGAKYKLAVVQFKVPGAKNGGSDKGPDGNRIDSIPIANSVIAAGGACDLLLYDSSVGDAAANTAAFKEASSKYDALIVRINPGQLSQGTPDGSQSMFDDLMNSYIAEGKLIWSSPKIQTQMGAKEADTKIEIYPSKTLGEVSLGDDDYVKLMEMNDNHVEYHTVKEFMTFCVGGPNAEAAGEWTSTFP